MQPITERELSKLRDTCSRSGYRYVYERIESRSGRRTCGVCGYIASPMEIIIGRYDSPYEAAVAVIRWMMDRFGDSWPSLTDYKNRPWKIQKRDPGWRVVIRQDGRQKIISSRHASRMEALTSLREWVRKNIRVLPQNS